MQVFYWLIFLLVIGIAIFAVQNSSAPPVIIKFLLWKFETSLVYSILGSIVFGMILTFLIWVQRALWASVRSKRADQKVPST
jgi:putative membrane protein